MNLDTVESVLSTLNKLQGLSAAGLVFLLCIAVGYAWRGLNFKWCPNEAIPAMVMVSGALAMMLIADGRPTTMPPHTWIIRNFAVGFVIGFFSWAAHNYIIGRFVEPWLKSKFAPAPPEPPAPIPVADPPKTP